MTDLRAARENGERGLGPVGGALSAGGFDRAVLVWNESAQFPRAEAGSYETWLRGQAPTGTKIELREVTLDNPIDFRQIYDAVVPVVEDVRETESAGGTLTFHLSPGTPAMAVVWILLASSRFPARLIQTSLERGIEEARLPFDIAANFVPDLVRSAQRINDLTDGLPPPTAAFEAIVHRCDAMKDLLARARVAAAREVPVVIEGPTGTGKELLARAIYTASPRSAGPFVAVNCGAIPEGLVESELFGHRHGAFTGATSDRAGVFEQAHEGTLFLDEIGELPLGAQVKLLRVLQEGAVQRVGDSRSRRANVRVIAATNRNLIEEARTGRFRPDLFYRLAVAVLRLPPLRERVVDILPLTEHFLDEVNAEQRKADPSWVDRKLGRAARDELRRHSWPGNVRELRNTLSRAVIWSTRTVLERDDIRQAVLPSIEQATDSLLGRPLGEGLDLRALTDELQRHYVERALKEAGGNKSKAAALVGLPSYQTLTNWIERLGINQT